MKIDTFLYISKEMVRQRCDNMATRYPRANVSKGSILNQGTFVSVTFGHLPLNLVTFGHLFRGLFEYIYHQTNHRIINFFDSQREYTIANDSITPARGTRRVTDKQLLVTLMSFFGFPSWAGDSGFEWMLAATSQTKFIEILATIIVFQ